MSDKFENIEISDEQADVIRNALTEWKEETYVLLSEEVETEKARIKQELEEEADDYKQQLKEQFTEKFVKALEEMRRHVKAEALVETIETNPALHILEEIKELVAPLLNEEYSQNTYSEELLALKEENEALKRELELEEGAQHLANLIAPFDDRTQDFVLSMISEGNKEEVSEQFYSIIEKLNALSEADEEDEDEDEEDGEGKKKSKKTKSKKSEEDDEDDDDDEDEEDDDEDDDDEEDDEDDDEVGEGYVEENDSEEISESVKESKKVNKTLASIKNLI